MPPLASSLTATGVLWAFLSLIASLVSATGFYMPFWMTGILSDGTVVSFSSFRRCNYPRLTPEGTLVMIHECGRYTAFSDIPSTSWQVTTVTVGLGAALALLVAFTALSACCLADVITKTTARILGLVQLVAGEYLFFFIIYFFNISFVVYVGKSHYFILKAWIIHVK